MPCDSLTSLASGATGTRFAATSSLPALHWRTTSSISCLSASSRQPGGVRPHGECQPRCAHLPFARECEELQNLAASSKLSRYADAVKRLPDVGPDPRRTFAGKPPGCYENWSESRGNRIAERWHSIPRSRCQLPSSSLQAIERRLAAVSPRAPDVVQAKRQTITRATTEVKLMQASQDDDRELRRSKRDSPFIACTCCDRDVPKPWKTTRDCDSEGCRRRKHNGSCGAADVVDATRGPGRNESLDVLASESCCRSSDMGAKLSVFEVGPLLP